MSSDIPLHTLSGVPNAEISTHYLTTEDGLGLNMLRFTRNKSDDVVLIIHGLTTSTDMFIMPEHYNLVRYLLDHGYGDVFCFDYRMSNRHPYNLLGRHDNMDDIALFDYPPALERIRQLTGGARIHVISHCLGAVSFLMSVFGKASLGVSSVIANSAGLTPRVPLWSHVKLYAAPVTVEKILGLSYLNPNWSEDPTFSRGKVISKLVSMVHRECDVPACHMLSLMWGTGAPALYNHRNLAEVTHHRGGDLYGATGVHYYRHVRKMVRAGNAVKYDPSNKAYRRLPDDYFHYAAEIDVPMLLVTGNENHVFKDSNVVCYRRLEAVAPGRHKLKIIDGYGHQDVFMGDRVHKDVFPHFLEFLDEQRARPSAHDRSAERALLNNAAE